MRSPRLVPTPSAEQTRLLNKRLVDWLRYASVQQGPAHSSGGFFSTPRARPVRRRDPEPPCPWAALGHLASLAHGAPLTSCPATCPAPRTTPLSCLHLVGGWGTFGSQRVTAPQPMTLGVTVQVWTLLPRAPPPTEGRVPSPGAPNASYEGAGG